MSDQNGLAPTSVPTIRDEEIVSARYHSRRSLLATTGISVVAGLTAVVASTMAAHADSHKVDMRDKGTSADPSSTDAD